MGLNARLDRPARVDAKQARWVAAPASGVERCLLERDNGGRSRATSLVRYAPNARPADRPHRGGEEILVLEGVFADDAGEYPAGTYVRDPEGNRCGPHTGPGCLILVKHRSMHTEDTMHVRRHVGDPRLWQPGPTPGVRVLHLHRFRQEETLLLSLAAGSALPSRALPGGEELFVLAGDCHDADNRYGIHVWLRHPAGSRAPCLITDTGCQLFVKRGHLARFV